MSHVMIRFWTAGLLVSVTALLAAALVAYAQLGDSETAGGTVNAGVGTAPPASATPRPSVQGDVDCSGGATPVSAVDALNVLRFVAGLPVTQTEPCDDIGTGGPPVQGNVDCSIGENPVSAVDALKILRSVAGLTVSQQQSCRPLGT